jgi:hypothetical protein
MGQPVLILGESGTGKSTSMRNCTPDRFGIINVSKKPLPFKSSIKTYNTDDYAKIIGALKVAKTPSIVIDDSQYLMVNAFMRRSMEKGYDKYNEMANNHWNLIQFVVNNLPDNMIVYFMSHIERDQMGNEKAKTIGRMIDQYVTLEGLFTIVLKTHVMDGKYTFLTHNSGFDTVKTPLGMFDSDEIDNDLVMVDDTIRNYYNIGGKTE